MTDKQIIIDNLMEQLKVKEQECEELKKELHKNFEEKDTLHLIIDRLLEASGYDTNTASKEDFEDVYEHMRYEQQQLEQLKAELEQEKALKETYLACYKTKHEDIEGELFKLRQYKASKQASYEALQIKCNELELENRELKEYQKLLEEQMKFNQSELELSLSSEINRSKFLLKEFKRVDKQKDNWREKAERYKQTLTKIKEYFVKECEFCKEQYAITNENCIDCQAQEILQKISEVIKDEDI